jgi:DNA-binding IclR family transcriptional regulator
MAKSSSGKNGSKVLVPALERAFLILDALSRSSIGLTKRELSSMLGIPYSTTFNLLTTMTAHGYLDCDEASGKYRLGLKLFSFGNMPPRNSHIREAAAEYLDMLVRSVRLTAHLAVLDRGEAVYIDRREADGFFKVNSWIGKRNYVHTSAVGKALMAFQPKPEVETVWKTGLPRRTEKTVRSLKQFLAVLQEVKRIGFALDDEEDEPGGRCVAAPILDGEGAAVASIGVSGHVFGFSMDRAAEVGAVLTRYAQEIAARCGYAHKTS